MWRTLAAVAFVGGCTQPVPPEEIRTVSWYAEHRDERIAKQHWCADDAARQATTNCMNAAEASNKVMMQPNVKSSSDDLKFK